jgi:hypothetical protein
MIKWFMSKSKLTTKLPLSLIFFLVFLPGCDQPEIEINILPRENQIPLDAKKIFPDTDLYPPILHHPEWEEPIPVPGLANSAGAEDSPFITPDGKSLYFTFVPDPQIPPEKQLIDGVTGLYVSKLTDGFWGEPDRVILNDDLSLDGCETIQGDVMWFCSVRAGNYREVDLYVAEYVNGDWVNWENAGERINYELKIGEMHISVDGSEIYFDGVREGGKGGSDIWLIRLIDGDWGDPENISIVNTEESEIRPFLTQDGSELWFSRRYQGSPAVFRSMLYEGAWSEPELIISQFAAEPSLDEMGNVYFAHHFFKDGEMLEADIYVARKK